MSTKYFPEIPIYIFSLPVLIPVLIFTMSKLYLMKNPIFELLFFGALSVSLNHGVIHGIEGQQVDRKMIFG